MRCGKEEGRGPMGGKMESVVIGGTYRHYKGKDYFVHGVVKHSETLEDLVLYDCLYENDLSKTWVRPMSNFCGYLEKNGERLKRFMLVSERSTEA